MLSRKKKKINLIEKYLNEELNAKELQQFEQLQKTDSDFAEEVQVAVAINADFNVQQKLRWQSLLEEQGSSRATPVRQLTPRKSSINWIRSIAAVFILGLGLSMAWMLFSSPEMGELADAQLINVYNAPTVTMDTEEIDSNWKNAIDAYKDGNFSVAVAAIESSIEKNEERIDEKHFYLGLSYLYEDVPNLDKAITHLAKSKEMNAPIYAAQANWFMSLAYLKQGNKESAKALLQEVVNANDWKKAEATALLNQL